MSSGQEYWLGLFKKLARSGGVYLFFSLVNRAVPFVILPLLTQYIDPAGYGIISVITIVTAIAMPIVGICGNSVLLQRYYKMNGGERSQYLADSYKMITLNTSIVCLLAIPLSFLIEDYLKISLEWFQVGVVCAATGMVSTLTTVLFQIKKKAFYFGVFQSANVTLNVSLSLLFVVAMGLSWQGRMWGVLLSSILISFLAIYLNWKNGDIEFGRRQSKGQVGTLFRLGGALIPSAVSGWAISMSDRVLLTTLTSMEWVGIYAIGVMVAQISDVFLNALGQVSMPYIFRYGHSDDPNDQSRLVKGLYAVIAGSVLIAFSVSMIGPWIIIWFINERFHGAAEVVGWICWSSALFHIAAIFQNLILVAEKNAATIYVSTITLVVSFLGGYVLIQGYGMVGAAMANVLSAFIFMALTVVMGVKYSKLPWFDVHFGNVFRAGK